MLATFDLIFYVPPKNKALWYTLPFWCFSIMCKTDYNEQTNEPTAVYLFNSLFNVDVRLHNKREYDT